MKIIRNYKLTIIFIHYELKLVSEAIIGSGDFTEVTGRGSRRLSFHQLIHIYITFRTRDVNDDDAGSSE